MSSKCANWLDSCAQQWHNTATMHITDRVQQTWRCRGPGGSHRLQNGWGAARRGPWWVRLPYASALLSSSLLLLNSSLMNIRWQSHQAQLPASAHATVSL